MRCFSPVTGVQLREQGADVIYRTPSRVIPSARAISLSVCVSRRRNTSIERLLRAGGEIAPVDFVVDSRASAEAL